MFLRVARTLCLSLVTSLALFAPAQAQFHSAETSATAVVRPQLTPASSADVLRVVADTDAKAVIVNLWATWCVPCRKEFPDLMRFHGAYRDRGVALVLVSGDFSSDTDAAVEFLSSQGVDFPSYLKSGKDQEFIDGFDPNWSGALPATFVYDANGERVHSFLGPITYESLEHVVAPLLGTIP